MASVESSIWSWPAVMKLVNERNRRGHQIVAVFHPEASGAPFETRFGCVRAEKGEPSYLLTTGDIIEI